MCDVLFQSFFAFIQMKIFKTSSKKVVFYKKKNYQHVFTFENSFSNFKNIFKNSYKYAHNFYLEFVKVALEHYKIQKFKKLGYWTTHTLKVRFSLQMQSF